MRVEILDVQIDDYSYIETIEEVENYILNEKPLHLMGVNADKINFCFENKDFRDLVNNCGIINPDGASAILASKYLGLGLKERIAGIDLMQTLLKLSEKKQYRVYFLGAKESTVKEMVKKIGVNYPRLQIVGFRDGYFSKEQWTNVFIEVNQTKPDIVFVGITSPLKEYLVEEFISLGGNSVYMGVGGSFDVLSGNIKRAPTWLQKTNLEWLYRMIQEPRRLFKRYLVGNIKFIYRIIISKNRS